jgi:hypothetical protein
VAGHAVSDCLNKPESSRTNAFIIRTGVFLMPYRVAAALIISCAVLATIPERPALAGLCMPVSTQVVSLGEDRARAYAARSLDRAIAEQESALKLSGRKLATTRRDELSCAPFPNIIGADEWKCTGSARVCAAE